MHSGRIGGATKLAARGAGAPVMSERKSGVFYYELSGVPSMGFGGGLRTTSRSKGTVRYFRVVYTRHTVGEIGASFEFRSRTPV